MRGQPCRIACARWLARNVKQILGGEGEPVQRAVFCAINHKAPAGPLETALPRFTQALCEDLNMARAIAALNEAVAVEDNSACAHRELAALQKMDSVLGVLERNTQVATSGDGDFEAKVNALIEVRAAARRNKDFAASDRARDELVSLGVQIKDGATGTTWTRAVRA